MRDPKITDHNLFDGYGVSGCPDDSVCCADGECLGEVRAVADFDSWSS